MNSNEKWIVIGQEVINVSHARKVSRIDFKARRKDVYPCVEFVWHEQEMSDGQRGESRSTYVFDSPEDRDDAVNMIGLILLGCGGDLKPIFNGRTANRWYDEDGDMRMFIDGEETHYRVKRVNSGDSGFNRLDHMTKLVKDVPTQLASRMSIVDLQTPMAE